MLAQEESPTWNVSHWEYRFFEEWEAIGDTIYGKADEKNTEYFYLHNDHFFETGGIQYMMVIHYPQAFPAEIRRGKDENPATAISMKERRYYSIGVRRAEGKVYTNREDFLYYQHYIYDNGFAPMGLLSFGNPDYQPYHLTDDGKEIILYDYTMEVGDSYRHVDGYDDIVVLRKDTVVFLDQVHRRRLLLSNGLVLVEGMGCINSNGMLIDYLNPAETYQRNYTYLARCTDHTLEQVYYDYAAAGLHVEELGTLGLDGHSSETQSVPHQLYDLQGRRLTQKPQHGLYIKNGKKVLVK